MAVLSLVVFAAINPKKRIQQARDTNRATAVGSIISAIYMYINENNGALPEGLVNGLPVLLTNGMAERQLGTSNGTGGTSNPTCVISTGGCNVAATSCMDLATSLNKYLASIPVDPLTSTFSDAKTGYSVVVNANGIVTIRACGAEQASSIFLSR
jgi:hypothetical protein